MLESRLDIRVEWGHCDPARIVYNPNFYDWMEHGLMGLFQAAGLDLTAQVAADPDFRGTPLVRSEAVFRAPARVGDVLVLSTSVVRWGSSAFDVRHVFRLGETLVCEGLQTRVWGVTGADDALATAPVPGDVRAALSQDCVTHLRLRRE